MESCGKKLLIDMLLCQLAMPVSVLYCVLVLISVIDTTSRITPLSLDCITVCKNNPTRQTKVVRYLIRPYIHMQPCSLGCDKLKYQ